MDLEKENSIRDNMYDSKHPKIVIEEESAKEYLNVIYGPHNVEVLSEK